ncbi:PEPxxWA-CTERM sorting domain-containing protein [Kordiimonas sp. SCSIO 12610]|uniref:PEPxxWA-CTERM sorting domain-containing protein n=1 Tax=Kordiimonas sp. SCSIO 12610 TaxID=2829597 RepID=UPI00210A2E1C|nr:PEPxxWA-CTERM sorting domain-containing protein [Kordiimonas sp. SCSIO 12610]UTW54384.1 PEP-CTERM sorting domain-containing protein [Kordiimonas sp. SCSIO 12610]
MKKILLAIMVILSPFGIVNAQSATFELTADANFFNTSTAASFGFDGTQSVVNGAFVLSFSVNTTPFLTDTPDPVTGEFNRALYGIESTIATIGNQTFTFGGGSSERIGIINNSFGTDFFDIFVQGGLRTGTFNGITRNILLPSFQFVSRPDIDTIASPSIFNFTADNYNSGARNFTSQTINIGGLGSVRLQNHRISNVVFTSAVPEPATWLMMIIGFAVLGLALKHRERALVREIS